MGSLFLFSLLYNGLLRNVPLFSTLKLTRFFALFLSYIIISHNQLRLAWILINQLVIFQSYKLNSIQQRQQAEIQKCKENERSKFDWSKISFFKAFDKVFALNASPVLVTVPFRKFQFSLGHHEKLFLNDQQVFH